MDRLGYSEGGNAVIMKVKRRISPRQHIHVGKYKDRRQ